ncbi:MAG: LysR family transcriptional regulator [Actinomycetota bacterium]
MPLDPTTPELSALDLFVSVVNLGSLSKGAAAHHISQPSASSRILGLEQRLGLTLLDRSPTGSTPTAAGSLVAGWAESVLRSANELQAGVAALKASRSGRLRVAASYTIAEYLLPPWLEQFLRNRPDDSVELVVANSTAVLDLLAEGRAELGFIESPLPTPTMTEQVVAHDRLIAVVGRHHPWAGFGSIPLEALLTTSLVVRERGSGTRETLESALSELGHPPPPAALELGSTSAIRAAVMAGGPPTVLSHRAVAFDLDAGSLVEVPIDGLRIERRLRAVWPRTASLPPLAEALLKQLPRPAGDATVDRP